MNAMQTAIVKDDLLRQAVEDYPIARMIAESDVNASKEEARRGKSGPWIIAAILFAALVVSYYQWNRHTTQTKIYAEVMKDYNPPINKGTRGITSNSDLVDQAIKEFDLRNFDTSNNLFKGTNPKSDSIYWYMGHIALINGNVYEAKHHMKKISSPTLQNDLLKYIEKIISK